MIMTPRVVILLPAALALLCVLGGATIAKKTYTVTIDDMTYSPDTLKVRAGDAVRWVNNDVRDHTVRGKGWDSGNLGPGESYKHTFTKPGEYRYACSLHPRMKGVITVSPSD